MKEEMRVLTSEKGVNSFKAFMAYKDVFQLDDGQVIRMFKVINFLLRLGPYMGLIVSIHFLITKYFKLAAKCNLA